MSLSGIFKRKEEDSEVKEVERRAYEKEREIVKREKKRKAVKEAAERGRLRARGKIGAPTEEKAAKVGKGILEVGSTIMKIGNYSAGLNWGGGVPGQQQPAAQKGKKRKKRKAQKQQQDSFAMPNFPF